MSIQLSYRVQRIKPSPTLAISAKTASLKAEGIDVISLSVGEPDFDTPPHIKKAAIAAIESGFTKYTAVEGIIELRKAIVKKFAHDNQLDYLPNQVLVSSGCKQSFFNLAQALLNTGDEVIIPAPYWVSYPDMVLLADATPVFIFAGATQNFKISPAQLEATITPKTKLFVINSPSNPSGMAYTRAELEALGAVLAKYPHVFIVTDDMYEHIFWQSKPFCNIVSACPTLADRTVVLNGVSKTFAMTGWRIGYAAGPLKLIEAMTNIQSQSTSNPCSISQIAAKEALEGDKTFVTTMVKAFKERHDFVVAALNKIKGIECCPGDGTFYVFPKVKNLIEDLHLKDDLELTSFFLEKARVAVVPGTVFGAEGYIRLSFATRFDLLQEALARIENAIAEHLTIGNEVR